jgi:hypothetical protein
VFFMTDNYVYPTPGPTDADIGMSTRSVLAMSDDDGNTFHYLYDFSKGPGAKFVQVAEAAGANGYLYFWGTMGGHGYRHSDVYFARKPAATIDQPGGMEYFAGVQADGSPLFSAAEADAVPLFTDVDEAAGGAAPCAGELGVEWNAFVQRWVMLYNCDEANPATGSTPGIDMRLAEQPWGPWTVRQTIFDPWRDNGYCHFMHAAVTPPCDTVNEPGEVDQWGGAYGPYFVSRFTTGDATCGTSTFYWTVSTWEPYQKFIMKSTIAGPGAGQETCSARGGTDSSPARL